MIVLFSAMRIKVGNEGLVQNKTVYIAIGVRVDGSEETHGLWLEQDQRRQLLAAGHEELRSRGFEDVLLAIVDGLRTLTDAILAMFPGQARPDLQCTSSTRPP